MDQTTPGDEPHRRTHLFMVRVWYEQPGESKTEWRGQLKHVLSGEVRYFRNWTTLVEQMKLFLSKAENNASIGMDRN